MKSCISILASAIATARLTAATEPGAASLNPTIQQTNNPSPQSLDTNALSLDHVLIEVLSSNPSLKAARASWEAMRQRVPQARAWEDLRGGFDTVAGRFVDVPRNSFTDQKLMLEQTVPVTGKNRLRAKRPRPKRSQHIRT